MILSSQDCGKDESGMMRQVNKLRECSELGQRALADYSTGSVRAIGSEKGLRERLPIIGDGERKWF